MNDWICLNGCGFTELDSAGRCLHCGSDAVDIALRPAATAEGVASAYMVEIDLYDYDVEWGMLHE